MISTGRLVAFLVLGFLTYGLIQFLIGATLMSGNVSSEKVVVTSLFVSAICGLILVIPITSLYKNGNGYIAETERLRSNEAYEVVEVIESPGRQSVLIVEDYKGILFAIGLTDSDISVVKENRLVSVDKDHNGSRIVPLPRPKEFHSEESEKVA